MCRFQELLALAGRHLPCPWTLPGTNGSENGLSDRWSQRGLRDWVASDECLQHYHHSQITEHRPEASGRSASRRRKSICLLVASGSGLLASSVCAIRLNHLYPGPGKGSTTAGCDPLPGWPASPWSCCIVATLRNVGKRPGGENETTPRATELGHGSGCDYNSFPSCWASWLLV